MQSMVWIEVNNELSMNNAKIKKPVIIIGCPRSGTSLLFRLLDRSTELFSLQAESHSLFSQFYFRKQAESKEYNNDALTDKDLTDDDKKYLLDMFHKNTANFSIFNTTGLIQTAYSISWKPVWHKWVYRFHRYFLREPSFFLKTISGRPYRIVEKTPRNCFRISFLDKLFPDAQYIFLKRDGIETISSLIEGWKRGNPYVRTPEVNVPLNIKGIEQQKWCFVLPPGWQDYIDKSVEEVAAFQWISANRAVINGLKRIDKNRVYTLCYKDLVQNTEPTVKGLCEFIQIPYAGVVQRLSKKNLPIVKSPHGDKPYKDKWRKHEGLLKSIYPMIEPMMTELGYDFDYIKEERLAK